MCNVVVGPQIFLSFPGSSHSAVHVPGPVFVSLIPELSKLRRGNPDFVNLIPLAFSAAFCTHQIVLPVVLAWAVGRPGALQRAILVSPP
jgi:hypothetical protein